MGRFPDEHLQALEQKRKDVANLRHIWITKRQPFIAEHLPRLAFLDETSVKTNMAKTTGWAPRGQRLADHVPFEHWRTQTFIGALRHNRLEAPWVIDGAMNGKKFTLYAETQLAPTLREGDVVILPSHRIAAQYDCRALDNLSSHKAPCAAAAPRAIGAWFYCSGETPHVRQGNAPLAPCLIFLTLS